MSKSRSVDLKTLRAFWVHVQGLAPPAKCKAWLHAIGGVDVFLASRARTEAFTRAKLDRSVATDKVRIVPGARGCTMLVPRRDVPVARQLGSTIYRKRTDKELAKIDVSGRELAALGKKVLPLLAAGGLEPAALRAALPPKAIRSLGEPGKRLGHSTTLPVVLRYLEAQGRIRRAPIGGRLDAERYEWMLDDTDAAAVVDSTDLATLVGRHYFATTGPATLKDFATWAGLTQRDAKPVLETLKLQELEVRDQKDSYWMLRSQADTVARPPAVPRVVLVSLRDPILDARTSPLPLIDEEHWGVRIESWGSTTNALREVNSIHGRCILVDGAVGGLWDYDPDSDVGIWGTFVPAKGALRKEIQAQCDAAAAFLSEEFGHALIYPMENAKSRASRLASVRGLGA